MIPRPKPAGRMRPTPMPLSKLTQSRHGVVQAAVPRTTTCARLPKEVGSLPMGAMRRREFVRTLGAAAVVVSFNARAQEAGRIYRVGGVTASPRNAQIIVAMFEELRRAGFVEGQNLAIDWRTYGTNPDLIPELMADLVKAHVDVIYDAGDPAIRAVARCNKDDFFSRDYRRYVGGDYGEGLRLAAGYIDRILKGREPGRSSIASSDQVRTRHQHENREGAGSVRLQ
jgi:hypothetical protein